MKTGIIKDLLSCRLYIKTYMMMLVLFLGIGFVMKNPYYTTGIFMIIPTMLIISSFGLDENSKWERLALCSTLSRKDLVLSKYAFGYFVVLCAAILNLISMILSSIDISEVLITACALLILSIVYISLMIPLMFKFGVEKSRILMMLVMIVPALGVIGLATLVDSSVLQAIEQSPLTPIIVVVLVVGMVLISYRVSYHIVKNKDY